MKLRCSSLAGLVLRVAAGLILAAVFGCGGQDRGAAEQPVARGVGSVTVNVKWPEPGQRLIPYASEAIRFQFFQDGEQVKRYVIAKPATSAQIDDIPAGDTEVRIEATPDADGTANAQAAAVAVVRIQAGETNSLAVHLQSTIARFVIEPSPLAVALGQTRALYATAYAADGSVVVLPDAVTWQVSTGGDVVALSSRSGTPSQIVEVTGSLQGTASLLASFLESEGAQRSAAAQVVVGDQSPSLFDAVWQTLVGTSSIFDQGNGVAVADSGNIYVVCTTAEQSYAGAASGATFVAKLSPDGVVLWRTDYESLGSCNDVGVDAAENVYLAGSRWQTDHWSGFVAKIAPTGGLVWVRELEEDGSYGRPFAIDVSSAGDYRVTGYLGGEGYVASFSSQGERLWRATFSGDGTEDKGRDIVAAADGSIYVTGTIREFYQYNLPIVLRYDASGRLLWQRRIDGGGSSGYPLRGQARTLALGSDGVCYVTGGTASGPLFTGFAAAFGADGQQRWYSDVGMHSTAIAVTRSGRIILGGLIDRPDRFRVLPVLMYLDPEGNGSELAPVSTDEAGYIVKLAEDGSGHVIATGWLVNPDPFGREALVAKFGPF